MTRYEHAIELSNSEKQVFMECRRKWWLKYVRGLRTKYVSPVGPLPLGSRVHKCMELGYTDGGGRKAALKTLGEAVQEDYELAVELGEETAFMKEAELALAMIEGFFDWAEEEGLDQGWTVLENERVVKAPALIAHGEQVILKARLDQLVRRELDGAILFRDWKTAASLEIPWLHQDEQMLMYMTLLKLIQPEAIVTGGLYFILKKVKRTARAKPPFFKQEIVYHSDKELESFWIRLVSVVVDMVEAQQRLEAGENHLAVCPPRPSRDCSWKCEFRQICPMFDDGSQVELAIEDEFEVYDPYSYYEEEGDKETL